METVASSDSTVLVLGETGTGTGLVARAVHGRGRRCKRPLVRVNCATLASSLIGNELLGHEMGSFTGAGGDRVGRFQLAPDGTLFLDEIGELPLDLEPKPRALIPDGFQMLNALKEVHRTVAQGAHNQFGDLPWTARVEMLIQQCIMARPEMRDFLQSRAMVPYQEPWMPQVDTMKTMQGWSDVSVSNFRDLGVFGEQLLLTIRYANWIDVTNEESARNWARYWRPEIQTYIHAYRSVTGVDLANPDNVDFTSPSVHRGGAWLANVARAKPG